jgi:hypothetical protein
MTLEQAKKEAWKYALMYIRRRAWADGTLLEAKKADPRDMMPADRNARDWETARV